jgi:hypothetical protein
MTGTLTKPEVTTARWRVVIYYRSDNGLIDVEHAVEELEQVQELAERGPDWNAIDRIEITLASITNENLTIEGAEKL